MTGFEPVTSSLPRKRSTPELHRQKQSGRRNSNPRPSAWKADALPTELLPLLSQWGGQDSNLRRRMPADLQSAPVGRFGTSPIIHMLSRWRDSNPRPADYKSAALDQLSYIGFNISQNEKELL